MNFDWIITHGDCDGVCSAAICLSANPEAKVFFSHPAGLVDDLSRITEGNVIICDIAVSKVHSEALILELNRLAYSWRVTYIDHHPVPKGFIRNLNGVESILGEGETSSSELTWKFFERFIPADISRVAIYGAIADYSENTPTIMRLLESWDKRELFLESGLLVEALSGKRKRDYEFKRHVVRLLSNNLLPSSDEEVTETAIRERGIDEEKRKLVFEQTKITGKVSHVFGIDWSLGKAAIYARAYGQTLIGVAGENRGDSIDLSVRGIGDLDLGKITEDIALKLGGSGGGHRKAAGARIPSGRFEEFIEIFSSRLF